VEDNVGSQGWRDKLARTLAGRRFTVVCLGSPELGDDAAGILVAEELRRRGLDPVEAAVLLDAVGPLKRRRSEAVVVVDAVLAEAPPGTILVYDAESLDASSPLASTHRAPPSLLQRILGVPVYVAGIAVEARRLAPGPPSPRVRDAARKLAALLAGLSRAGR